MFKTFMILFLGCILLPIGTQALMPPEDIAERNLNAELVLIGKVLEMGKILLPLGADDKTTSKGLFVLKTYHVIKGFNTVKPEDLIRIIYRLPPKVTLGMTAVIAGQPPVKVKDGDLVLVHINATSHTGFYTPVLAGSSVVNIDLLSPTDASASEKKGN